MIPRLPRAVRLYSTGSPGSGGGGGSHYGTNTGRSSSILASLLRLRQQYQRAGGAHHGNTARANRSPAVPSASDGAPAVATPRITGSTTTRTTPTSTSASSSHSSSSSSTPMLLWRDALRLLNTETRASDALSDVPKTSPQYGAEVGKLLAVAATFGGSVSSARVEEALGWVTAHPQHLTTTRQLMSIAMPLLNLQDGSHGGAAFVCETLSPLLLVALRAEGAASPDTDVSGTTSNDAHRQSVVAVVSVFQLVPKLLASGSSDSRAESVVTRVALALTLFEAASAALSRLCGRGDAAVLEIPDCVHCVEAYLALEQTISGGADDDDDNQKASALDSALRTHVLPVLYTFFSPNSDNGTVAAPLATNASLRGMTDMARLLQAFLALSQRVPASTPRLLGSALSLLPGAISAASAREMANASTIVTRVRQAHPSLVVERHTLAAMMEAMRPKLFQLVGTHQSQLGALECSVLLTNLSKWGGDANAPVPEDLVEMLFARMAAQMRFAHAPQLVPLCDALARFSRSYGRSGGPRGSSGGSSHSGSDAASVDASAAFFRSVPSAEVTLREAHQRALALLQDDGKLSATDAAHILTSLSDLHLSSNLAEDFFLATEPLIKSLATSAKPDTLAVLAATPTSSSSSSSAHLAPAVTAHARTVALQALESFLADQPHHHPDEDVNGSAAAAADSRRRAMTLRDALHQDAMAHASTASSAKELVMLYRSLSTSEHSAQPTNNHAAHQTRDSHDDADAWSADELSTVVDLLDGASGLASAVRTAPPQGEAATQWEPFVSTVARLAPTCNVFEVSNLLTAVTAIGKKDGPASTATARTAQEALMARAADPALHWSLADAKRFMDAVRTAGAMASLSPVFLESVAHLLTTTTTTASTSTETDSVAATNSSSAGAGGLPWATHVGRTLLSLLRRGTESECGANVAIALCHCCTAYAQWCETLVDAALESQHGVSSDALVQQLCLLCYVLGQMKRVVSLSASRDGAAPDQRGGGDNEDENGDDDNDGGDGDAQASSSSLSGRPYLVQRLNDARVDLSQHVDDAMLSVGDAVQLLLLRHADLSQLTKLTHSSPDTDPGTDALDDDDNDDGGVAASSSRHATDSAAGLVTVHPKQLIMLLQAYEAADVRHPTLFDDLLPSLVSAADSMDALELSLLMTSLAHLGVWNARVVMQLAQRAESQLAVPLAAATNLVARRSVMRQANGLLRALHHARALPATTFLVPTARQQTFDDWRSSLDDSTTTSTAAAYGYSAQSAFVALAQAALNSLDTLVDTYAAMRETLEATTLQDLVGVVEVLTGCFASPPQPTTDAYIVLAVKKLAETASAVETSTSMNNSSNKNGAETRLRAVITLLSRVHVMRRYDHRVASVRTIATAAMGHNRSVELWTALQRLTTVAVVQLLTAHFTGELFYGVHVLCLCAGQGNRAAETAHGETQEEAMLDAVATDLLQQQRWAETLSHTPAGHAWPREWVRGVEQYLQYVPVHHFASLSPMHSVIASRLAAPDSLPPLSTLRRDRELRNGLLVALRVANTVAMANAPSSTARHDLRTWLEALLSRDGAAQDAVHTVLRAFTARQLATLWVSLALAVSGARKDDAHEAARLLAVLLPAVQEGLHAKESQLQLPHAVDLLLGAAQLFPPSGSQSTDTNGDLFASLPPTTQTAVLSMAQLGALTLTRTLHAPEPTGLPKLYESYRLILAGDACFPRWLATLKARPDSPEPLRAMEKTVGQVLRLCASCLHVADTGGVRVAKLSPHAMTRVTEAMRRALRPPPSS